MKFLTLIDKRWWWFVPIIALVAYGIIMVLGHAQPIWFDEGYSILLAKSSFADLWSLTAVDAHPPLFYVLLKVWGSVFGFSEFALRSFSAVTMASAIALAASLVRRLFSTKVALIATPFLLFAPFLLRYGYEVRMYALATLIAVGATYALINATVTKSKVWWGVYALLVAAGMYTLYLTVAVWIAHVVWLFTISLKSKERPFWKWQWWYAFAGAVLLFAAYIPTFLHQLFNSALPGMGSPVTATKLVDIASSLLLYTSEWALGGWLSILLVAVVATLVWLAICVHKTLSRGEKRGYSLLIVLATVPLLFFALTSLPPRDPIFIIRYMAHVSVFVYLLVGVTLALAWVSRVKVRSAMGNKSTLALVVLLVLGSFVYGVVQLSRAGNFNIERMQRPMTHDVRSVVVCDLDTTVIARDPYTYIDSAFYFEDCDLRFYAKEAPAYAGGYAMLHSSTRRISSPEAVAAKRLVVLSWTDGDQGFTPTSDYLLTQTYSFDKQQVLIYTLIAE